MKAIQSEGELLTLAETLFKKHESHGLTLPIKAETRRFADEIIQALFPSLSENNYFSPEEIEAKLVLLQRNVKAILHSLPHKPGDGVDEIVAGFVSRLPEIHNQLWLDADAIYRGDPAAESVEEVVLAYPGFLAIAIYRIAHEFYLLEVPIFPRLLTEYAHQLTGIDIHPGAKIGTPFFIDHGTGIVVGETTVIGDNVKIYQGVTLGALSVDKSLANTKRHPTIEDNVIIYAQAVILGGDTVIGHDSVVGGNSWLTRSVPPFSFVYTETKVNVRTPNETNGGIDFVI
jgi:serine O-acetyltransferase